MTANLDNILAGIAGRRAMDRHQHLVDQVSCFGHDLTQVLRVGGELGWHFLAAEDFVRDLDRLWAGHSHQGDGTFASGARNRGDCFIAN